MKKHLFKPLFAALALTLMLTVTSCGKDEPTNDPIDLNVETPRYGVIVDDNLYLTCYYPLAVARFDTRQQAFTGVCNLGGFHPEGICQLNGKLYIASSNISDENYNYSYDNKVYVVDINTFTLVDSITVNLNPTQVKALDNSHIVVNTMGDYPEYGGTTYGATQIVNVNNKEVTSLSVALTNFDVYDGDIYGYKGTAFYKIDGTSHASTAILADWDASKSPYGISLNPKNGDIVVTTDGSYRYAGDCVVYKNDGTLRMGAIQLGMLPSKAAAVDENSLLVLNEGNWGNNEAGISRVDVSNGSAVVNYFSDNNGRGLGDVGQDLLLKGGKAYILVSFSNSIEIMDVATGKSTRFATSQY